MLADRDRDRDTDIDIFPIIFGVWTLQDCEPLSPADPGAAFCHRVAWPGALTSIMCSNICKVHSHPFFPHVIPTSPHSLKVAKPNSNADFI